MDELINLFKKHDIIINTIGIDDKIYLERYGIVIVYSQKRLCLNSPKVVVREILYKFTQDKNYKKSIENYIKSFVKKESFININDKKRMIRKRLKDDGIIN